tara:strand:+ start:1335 stop:1640 length:306 start_codon:yes stop_codon:yes gene_type:complete
MTKHNNRHIHVYNVDTYLEQINSKTTKETKIKFLSRAANCYYKAGGIKYMQKAIDLYGQVYDMQSEIRGYNDTRTYDVLRKIVDCEKRYERLKSVKKIRKD